MAIMFMDGFEGYGTTNGSSNDVEEDLGRSWRTDAGGKFFLRPDSNSENHCLSFGTNTFAINSRISWVFPRDVIGEDIYVGLRFKTRDHQLGGDQNLCEVNGLSFGQAERHIVLSIDYGNGRFFLRRGGSTIDQSADSILVNNTWYHVEFKFNIDGSTGLYEVRLDGVDVMSDSNVDTFQSNGVFSLSFYGAQADSSDTVEGEYCLDDLYILDETGSINNNFLGEETRVKTLFPTADGTTNDFTPQSGGDNFAMVDDNPVDEADYTDGTTNADVDEYVFGGLSETTIYGAMLQSSISTFGEGVRTVRNRCRSGATVGNGADFTIADSYNLNEVFEVDPNTSSLWILSNLNAAQFGVEVRN